MQPPKDLNSLLRELHDDPCVLAPEDAQYLTNLIRSIKAGKKAVLIVEDGDDKLKYMFSYATRPEAVTMLGKVIEATGRRLHGA